MSFLQEKTLSEKNVGTLYTKWFPENLSKNEHWKVQNSGSVIGEKHLINTLMWNILNNVNALHTLVYPRSHMDQKGRTDMKEKRWIRISIAVVLLGLLVSGLLYVHRFSLTQYQAAALEELTQMDGQYDAQSIVLHDTTRNDAQELAQLLGADLRITDDGSFAALTLPDGTTICDVFADDANLEYLEQMSADYQVQISDLEDEEETGYRLPAQPEYAVSDDQYDRQDYLSYLNMGKVWGSVTGSGVTVAIIDTGIDTDHPEFAGRISEYSYNATEDKIVKDYASSDGQPDWSLIEDNVGHGTAVAGVLSAAMDGSGTLGIAPDAEILVIKAECDENGNFKRSSDLVFALYYAIERDVQVVNMSFGVSSNVFADAIRLAYDSDIVCVAAAGNEGRSALTYPAADPLVIGVGALEYDSWALAEYSNYGDNVNIVAPGTTYTTSIGGEYKTNTGTSLSAPQVAGAVALFMQKNRYATVDQVTEVLYASGYDLGALGRDWYYGFGALDLNAFLLEERGTITFDMLTDELENEEGLFIRNHTMQELPEPERLYAVFDGWYYDDMFTEEYNYYSDVFSGDLTLYAKWINEEDGVPYTYVTLDDGTIEIRSYTGHRRFITVPEIIDGKTVTSIGDYAFSGQSRLREITLPNSLTNIGVGAFERCTNLIAISIPSDVLKIGAYAFADNVRLSAVHFSGTSLHTIGGFAFAGCSTLEQMELPSGVTEVDGSAFYCATNLRRITVQSGNTGFVSNDGVLFTADGGRIVAYPAGRAGEYSLSDSCTAIGDYAFAFCKLSAIDLETVCTIGESAFANCDLQTLVIPDGVTGVGSEAFAYADRLAQVQLGGGLDKISSGLFAGCSSLTEIHIPAGIRTICDEAFLGSGLKSVTFAAESKLEHINAFAFCGCAITEIIIPYTVNDIGSNAFSNTPLTAVTLSADSQLKTIGTEAFRYCHILTDILLPNSLETISELAFADTGLIRIAVPGTVTKLGNGAFAYCCDLTAVTVGEGNTVYHDLDGIVYTLDNTTIHTYPAGRTETAYTLDAAATQVGSYAFAGTGNLDTVTLSGILTDINEFGFDCSGINTVSIPDTVIKLGRYSFTNCRDLTAVNFSTASKLDRISYGAFVNCGLTSFTVPANVSTMGQKVFQYCNALTRVTFAANSKLESLSAYIFSGCDNLRSITFRSGSALTSIQAHGLEGMSKLTSINFGDAKVTNIDNFAFRFCTSLSSLNVPQTVVNVGRYAFYGCEGLSELTLPAQLEHIGSYAFLGTTDLQLYLTAEHMPEYLDEDWDRGIAGYYVGVADVSTSDDYKYASLFSGNIAILEYLGSDTHVDLTAVDLGAPISVIGGKAFKDSCVTSVVLPDTLTEIQAEAFAYTGLTEVTIPAGVTFIGREAFIGTELANVTFSAEAEIHTIEQKAFAETEKLTRVTIPAGVTVLGSGVFQQSGLQEVLFAEGIQLVEIPQRAFEGTKLETAALPDSVTLVNHNAFNGVATLKSVSFGTTADIRLMSNAFYRTGLTELHIPENVTYIGEFCFVGLENLTAFSVDADNPNYHVADGLLLSKNGRKLIAAPAGRTGSLTLPLSVEEIGFGAFERSHLSEIHFEDNANILTLGCRAFFEAENLTSITIPASVVSVDYYAFAFCENLQTVDFAPDNQIKGIYEGAFCGDSTLKNISIPDSVTEISDFAFYGCSELDHIPAADPEALMGIYDYAFAYSGLCGSLTTPENLIDIGDYAFLGTMVEKVTIPDTKQKELIIGIGAFEDCSNLSEITLPFIGANFEDRTISWFGYIFGAATSGFNEAYIPQSLKTVNITKGISFIGKGGFSGCTGLETINLPSGIAELYNGSFTNVTASYSLKDPVMTYNYYGEPIVTSTHFGEGIVGEVILAEGITSVDSFAFENCRQLASIIMPDSIETLGKTAFFRCSTLTNVKLSAGLTSISEGAFRECSSLKSIEIPEGVVSIGRMAFNQCSSLTGISIPEGVTVIGASAFADTPLTEIELPSTLTTIDTNAFYRCYHLYTIYNNSALEFSIGNSSDYGCVAAYAKVIIDAEGNKTYLDEEAGFEYIDTPEGFRFIMEGDVYKLVAYIGEETTVRLPTSINGSTYEIHQFSGAPTVIIPGEFKTVAKNAFSGSMVVNFILEEGIESIGADAFASNRSLKSVVLPGTLKEIGSRAFSNCQNMETINIPQSITDIGSSAFSCCYELKEIALPLGIATLNDSVFSWCFALEQITIPESVTKIGNNVFSRCTGLKEVVMSPNVVSIGNNAFSQCTALESLILPQGITSIGTSAFVSSTDVILPDGNENFCSIDGILYDRDITRLIHASESIPENLVLPDTITSIPQYAFQNNTALRNIVIPEGVTSLERGAFQGSALESIELPTGLKTINESFWECKNLTEIILPDGLTKIGFSSFRDCSNLQRVFIPDTVTYIDQYAFVGCSVLSEINIPLGITEIRDRTFDGCGFTSIQIPNSVTKIADNAFYSCSNLQEIILPDSITQIGNAFEGCTYLERITLPKNLESISAKAFARCPNLKYIDNRSSFELSFGSSDHGMVALNATVIIDANGQKHRASESVDYEIIETEDGFRFIRDSGVYKLVAYMGDLDTITLPDSINGESYTLSHFNGGKTVIVPESMMSLPAYAFSQNNTTETIIIQGCLTEIEEHCFSGCALLKSVNIPDTVTVVKEDAFLGCRKLKELILPAGLKEIGQFAFGYCPVLESVVLPDGLESIGSNAFQNCTSLTELNIPASVTSVGANLVKNTALYQDPTKWNDDMLILGGWLLAIADDAKYLHDSADVKAVSCYGPGYNQTWMRELQYLKSTYWEYKSYLPSNLETLMIADIPAGSDTITSSLTLKNIVMTDKVGVADLNNNQSLFKNLTNVTIFVDGEERDLRWDDNFPGWNYGNKVIYGNNWIWANFYDEDGTVLLSEPKKTSAVIRRPVVSREDDQYIYELIGWDMDGDGKADAVPATSVTDIHATAVYRRTLKMYTVTFKDAQSGRVYSQQQLPYGASITPPADPEMEDRIFNGWSGYRKGMTVSGDIEFTAIWHTHYYVTMVTEPTCTEQGFTTHTCSCGDGYVDGHVEALGHSMGSWIGTNLPTCTEGSTQRRDCSRCDYFEIRTIPATGHNFSTWYFSPAPTCTEAGEKYRFCIECNQYETEAVPATGHSYSAEVNPPTCAEQGFTKHTCSACGDSYKDNYTDALGHSYDAEVISPTCTEQGFTTYTCSVCGDCYEGSYTDALGHDMTHWVIVTAPTCTTEGSEFRQCTRCEHNETRNIEAVGHSFRNWFVNRSATCTEDGEKRRNCANCSHYETEVIPASGHSYESVVTAPTCTEQGYTTYTCATCGDSCVDTYVDALGHDMGEWTAVIEATCTEAGSEQRDCSHCDYSETRTTEAAGHSFGAWFVNRSATCTEDGENRRNCANCSHYETEVIPATGHSYEAVVTAPTCTERGYTTYTCIVCGDRYTDSITDAWGHDWDEGIVTIEPTEESEGEMTYTCLTCGQSRTEIIPCLEHIHSYDAIVTAPTCTERGYTTHTCRCGDSYVDTYVDSLGHDLGEWITITEATCTGDGSDRRDCSRCDHNETRTIEATGHSYESVVSAPTCTERGYTTHTCSACGDTYVDTYVETLGHDLGEWENVIDATCTEDGQELRECARCDHYETRIIEAVGHGYETFVTAPTCTEQGYTRYVCTVCGDSYISDYVVPTGHAYEAVVTDPTCTEQGYTTHTCHCGDHYVSDYTVALGHDMGEWETFNDATCTEDGQERRECSRCDHSQTRAVEALGHKWDEGVVTVEPTEETAGQMTYTCERCSETRTESIPALEHEHRYEAVIKDPTCIERGYTTHTCRCGDSYVDSYLDALGHDMGEWETVTEATCTADGMEQRDCSRCEYHETRVTEAIGHNYKSVITEPTCTAQGFTTHTCHCGDSYTDGYTAAMGHSFMEYVTDGNATCTQDGTKTAVCDRCDAKDTVADEGSAHGHDFTDWTVVQKPTETAEGLESRRCLRCGVEETRAIACLENPFVDVPPDSFYYEPVMWAVENGITNGTSATTFGPNDQCMRAHVVTFLWRAVGSPEPTRTDNPFVDVKESDFYYKAVMWALENGITSGMDATHFGPTAYCNRAQVVTFLYRTMGSPEVESSENPFTDVAPGAFYEKAVLWAVENGITNGLSATAFGPNAICNRAQIVTFLYRAFVEE